MFSVCSRDTNPPPAPSNPDALAESSWDAGCDPKGELCWFLLAALDLGRWQRRPSRIHGQKKSTRWYFEAVPPWYRAPTFGKVHAQRTLQEQKKTLPPSQRVVGARVATLDVRAFRRIRLRPPSGIHDRLQTATRHKNGVAGATGGLVLCEKERLDLKRLSAHLPNDFFFP
jgi:hypothetical protein